MKKILLLIVTLTVFFCLQGFGQKKPRVSGDGVVSNNTTFKGKRALRKEKHIQHKASLVTASNERKAIKKRAKAGLPKGNRKPVKSKHKDNKTLVIEDKKLAKAEPKKD